MAIGGADYLSALHGILGGKGAPKLVAELVGAGEESIGDSVGNGGATYDIATASIGHDAFGKLLPHVVTEDADPSRAAIGIRLHQIDLAVGAVEDLGGANSHIATIWGRQYVAEAIGGCEPKGALPPLRKADRLPNEATNGEQNGLGE